MNQVSQIILENREPVPVFRFTTLVVGTGAAGYNAADTLYNLGHTDIAMVTEGINMGTSRNTGSDKQTYYKLTLAGDTGDSVEEMAKTLFAGGCMHGDIALAEAALSASCFFKLVNIGVQFPYNRYGEYVGYKTDHDPRQRATSCGPLTSRYMTQQLEKQVKAKGIPVFDHCRIVKLLTNGMGENKQVIGAVGLNSANGSAAVFSFTNLVYATGGPSGLYHASVYPQSQTCATGAALEAGAQGINLTESQYGIASIKFRWNLSGTYQQVIPTYISTAQDGSDPQEFLDEYFATPEEMVTAIFLKGYQWPFDPRKLQKGGSSIIDLAVYREIQQRGRRVFLDFRRNPAQAGDTSGLFRPRLVGEAKQYLENSGALQPTPIERLCHMNLPAYELYKNNGINLKEELLEIAVCAQHNNGGLAGNCWWESSLRGLFPVGEVNGTFGVYRPGGSALNSTQTGSTRAAQYIAANRNDEPMDCDMFTVLAQDAIEEVLAFGEAISRRGKEKQSPYRLRERYQKRMDSCGAFIRSPKQVEQAITQVREDLKNLLQETEARSPKEVVAAWINRDILITQLTYLSAIEEYIAQGGKSRGSYLIGSPDFSDCAGHGVPVELAGEDFAQKACRVTYHPESLSCSFQWEPLRPIPTREDWFETVYNQFRQNKKLP